MLTIEHAMIAFDLPALSPVLGVDFVSSSLLGAAPVWLETLKLLLIVLAPFVAFAIVIHWIEKLPKGGWRSGLDGKACCGPGGWELQSMNLATRLCAGSSATRSKRSLCLSQTEIQVGLATSSIHSTLGIGSSELGTFLLASHLWSVVRSPWRFCCGCSIPMRREARLN